MHVKNTMHMRISIVNQPTYSLGCNDIVLRKQVESMWQWRKELLILFFDESFAVAPWNKQWAGAGAILIY